MPLSIPRALRLLFCFVVPASAVLAMAEVKSPPIGARRVSLAAFNAVGDGQFLNTRAIQRAIDQLGADGGGTLVIPAGTFVTGAIFLKPGVNLHLEPGAVIKGSTDRKDYPRQMTRVEGHFEEWLPALVNADKAEHLRITGAGTLDGSGAPFWREFWTRLKADRKTRNLDVPRPRLALIQNSTDVQITGITFRDSAFWNLHLYRCRGVVVQRVRFEVPEGVRCPSTDGMDIDSSQDITIRGCTFRVDDDCVCLKGSKGPLAMADRQSPPVENIHVEDCRFERGHGAVTLGSEATVVRNVRIEHCRVSGKMPVLRFKLRADTPQLYEDVHCRNIALTDDGADPGGVIIDVRPWTQYFDLKGQPPPQSIVRNITMTGLTGSFGSFGVIEGNSGQTSISDVTLEHFDLQLRNERLKVGDVKNLTIRNVIVNGKPFTRD